MWEQTFPGMQQGAMLDESQYKQWSQTVEAVSSHLLKKFDKEHSWAMQRDIESKGKARKQHSDNVRHWQNKYLEMSGRGQVPINPQTQQPVSQAEFVRSQMSVADEIDYKEEMRMSDRSNANRLGQLTRDDIQKKLARDPMLKRKIQQHVMQYISNVEGRALSESELTQYVRMPEKASVIGEAMQSAIQANQEAFVR
jgi:hypothetical protein